MIKRAKIYKTEQPSNTPVYITCNRSREKRKNKIRIKQQLRLRLKVRYNNKKPRIIMLIKYMSTMRARVIEMFRIMREMGGLPPGNIVSLEEI